MDIQNVVYLSMKCSLAIKRNEVLIHGTTRINLENITLNEKSQTENAIYCMIPIICVHNRQILRNRKYNSGCQGLGEERI